MLFTIRYYINNCLYVVVLYLSSPLHFKFKHLREIYELPLSRFCRRNFISM